MLNIFSFVFSIHKSTACPKGLATNINLMYPFVPLAFSDNTIQPRADAQSTKACPQSLTAWYLKPPDQKIKPPDNYRTNKEEWAQDKLGRQEADGGES